LFLPGFCGLWSAGGEVQLGQALALGGSVIAVWGAMYTWSASRLRTFEDNPRVL
jgi:hypothetical protein